MMVLRFFLVMTCLCVIGCASPVDYVKIGKEYPPLPENAEVKVFLVKRPNQPYEEIGIIEIIGLPLEDSLEIAKEKAREIGGNALIRFQSLHIKFYIIRIENK